MSTWIFASSQSTNFPSIQIFLSAFIAEGRAVAAHYIASCLSEDTAGLLSTLAEGRTTSQPVILSACRTPIGKFGRSLLGVGATRLGAIVVREAVKRAHVRPEEVDEVILGNVLSAGLGQNPARQAAIWGGLPPSVGAFTVNKVCGSALKAVMLAAQAVRAGDCELAVAGGAESMSNAPFLVRNMRWGRKYGDAGLVDAMIFDGLWDAFNDYHMGITGEAIATKFGITRMEADEFAFRSNSRAAAAWAGGRFDEEVVPVDVPCEDGSSTTFRKDECFRADTTLEKLAKLKPAFKPDGILTAGNSSQLSDGASAVVVASEERAERMGAHPMARIVGYG
ncbi:MAG TPA: acetyl-CoA C-acyltransferase, partial [Nitrososphaerales archaeon]|nr:acetyl-CoA C-acyltransferase [Nitrososphaerales archaeon]